MIYNNILFHNVAELEQKNHYPGMFLQRFPKQVRHALGEKGRIVATQSNGCELRFVSASNRIKITISLMEATGKVLVFRGDFLHSSHQITAGVLHTIQLETPERFSQVDKGRLHNRAFSPDVWRIHFERNNAVFCGIDAYGYAVRPPEKHELPKLTFLAYGSSITQAAGAINHYNGYVQQAARRLEVDVLNLGLSGSCHCEQEVADHIAERTDWDFALFEIGVNMRANYTIHEFEKRFTYLLDTVTAKHANKPIFVTTIYPNRATYFIEPHDKLSEDEKRFNEVIRNYVASHSIPNLHLLEGCEIMKDFTSLTSDLIHPSDFGHILMGEQLASRMRPIVEALSDN